MNTTGNADESSDSTSPSSEPRPVEPIGLITHEKEPPPEQLPAVITLVRYLVFSIPCGDPPKVLHAFNDIRETSLVSQNTGGWGIPETKPFLSDTSKNNYRNAALRFFKHFEGSISVDRLTMEQLTRWKSQMLLTYSPATTAQTLRTTKSMFHFAVAMNWLSANPLDGIDCGSFRNPESERFVTQDEFRKIREQCTTWEQRAILTLARYGGLRSPSEVVRLKWSDIDWEKKSILVSAGKPTRDTCGRLVPLFPAVRRVLEEMVSDPDKGEFIVSSSREPAKAHFGAWFSKLVQKADIGRIPRPFDNMRSSRGVELYKEFGKIHAMAWMGYAYTDNSRFLSVRTDTEPEFKRATEWEEGD